MGWYRIYFHYFVPTRDGGSERIDSHMLTHAWSYEDAEREFYLVKAPDDTLDSIEETYP